MKPIIAKLRKQKGWNQEELAEKLHVSRSSVAMWESGRNYVPTGMLYELSKLFDCSIDELMGQYELASKDSIKSVRIPVLGAIPAGVPLEEIEDVVDWEEIPADWTRGDKRYFALEIHGESMMPRYEDGDVVIFRRQETCESGKDCAVMVNGDQATFKRVRLLENGMMLQALNPAYESYVFSAQQVAETPVRIIGVAVELRRKF